MLRAFLYLLYCSPRQGRRAHILREDVVQPIDQTVLSVDRSGYPGARNREEKVRRAEVEEAGNQATMTARET